MAAKRAFELIPEYHNHKAVITEKDGTQTRIILSTSMTDQDIRNAVGQGVPLVYFTGDMARLERFAQNRSDLKRKLNPVVKTTLLPPADGVMPVLKKVAKVEISDDNKIKMLAFDLSMNAELSQADAVAKAKEIIALAADKVVSEKELLMKAFGMKSWSAKTAFAKIHGK